MKVFNLASLFFVLLLLYPVTPVIGQTEKDSSMEDAQSENESLERVNQSEATNIEEKTVIINLFYNNLDYKALDKLMIEFHRWIRAGFKDFLLVINSSGGDLDTGIAAYNYLESLPITLRTHNIAQTSSAATLIYCAGDIRTASYHSSFLLHNGTSTYPSQLTPREIAGSVEHIQMKQQFSRSIISACTGEREREIERIFDAESVFNAFDAQRLGLVHEVRNITSEPANSIFTAPIGLDNYLNDYSLFDR